MKDFISICMSVQIMGTILNRCITIGDGMWGQLWEYIARSMKDYALSYVRTANASLVVLMGFMGIIK